MEVTVTVATSGESCVVEVSEQSTVGMLLRTAWSMLYTDTVLPEGVALYTALGLALTEETLLHNTTLCSGDSLSLIRHKTAFKRTFTRPSCLGISPSGDTAAILDGNLLHIYDLFTAKRVAWITLPYEGERRQYVNEVVLMEEYVVVRNQGSAGVYDMSGEKLAVLQTNVFDGVLTSLQTHEGNVASLTTGGYAYTWTLPEGGVVRRVRVTEEEVGSYAMSPCGAVVAVVYAHRAGVVGVYRLRGEGEEVTLLAEKQENYLRVVSFSPCGEQVAAGSYDGEVTLWTLPDTTAVRTVRMVDTRAVSLRCLSFSPCGKWIAAAGTEVLLFWNRHTNEMTHIEMRVDVLTFLCSEWVFLASKETVALAPLTDYVP